MQLPWLQLTLKEQRSIDFACGAAADISSSAAGEVYENKVMSVFDSFGAAETSSLLRWLAHFGRMQVMGIVGCDVLVLALENSIPDSTLEIAARAAGVRATLVENCGVNRKQDNRRLAGVSVLAGHSSHARDVMAIDAMSHGW